MGVHRGDAALRALGPSALRHIAMGLGCGLTVATIWGVATRNEHKKWDVLNKQYRLKAERNRKKFDEWLAKQPYDDEDA